MALAPIAQDGWTVTACFPGDMHRLCQPLGPVGSARVPLPSHPSQHHGPGASPDTGEGDSHRAACRDPVALRVLPQRAAAKPPPPQPQPARTPPAPGLPVPLQAIRAAPLLRGDRGAPEPPPASRGPGWRRRPPAATSGFQAVPGWAPGWREGGGEGAAALLPVSALLPPSAPGPARLPRGFRHRAARSAPGF